MGHQHANYNSTQSRGLLKCGSQLHYCHLSTWVWSSSLCKTPDLHTVRDDLNDENIKASGLRNRPSILSRIFSTKKKKTLASILSRQTKNVSMASTKKRISEDENKNSVCCRLVDIMLRWIFKLTVSVVDIVFEDESFRSQSLSALMTTNS